MKKILIIATMTTAMLSTINAAQGNHSIRNSSDLVCHYNTEGLLTSTNKQVKLSEYNELIVTFKVSKEGKTLTTPYAKNNKDPFNYTATNDSGFATFTNPKEDTEYVNIGIPKVGISISGEKRWYSKSFLVSGNTYYKGSCQVND